MFFSPSCVSSRYWLVDGCPTPIDISHRVAISKCSLLLSNMSYFRILEKPEMCGFLNRILRDAQTNLLPTKPGPSRKKIAYNGITSNIVNKCQSIAQHRQMTINPTFSLVRLKPSSACDRTAVAPAIPRKKAKESIEQRNARFQRRAI